MAQEFSGFLIVSDDERYVIKPSHPPTIVDLTHGPTFASIKNASYGREGDANRQIDTINRYAGAVNSYQQRLAKRYAPIAALGLKLKIITFTIT